MNGFLINTPPPPLWIKSGKYSQFSGIGIGATDPLSGTGYAEGGNYDYITIPRCHNHVDYQDVSTPMML